MRARHQDLGSLAAVLLEQFVQEAHAHGRKALGLLQALEHQRHGSAVVAAVPLGRLLLGDPTDLQFDRTILHSMSSSSMTTISGSPGLEILFPLPAYRMNSTRS